MGRPASDPVLRQALWPLRFTRALEDGYLLAECQVLRGECGAALEELSEEGGDELQFAH
jgi:hypothetical protein